MQEDAQNDKSTYMSRGLWCTFRQPVHSLLPVIWRSQRQMQPLGKVAVSAQEQRGAHLSSLAPQDKGRDQGGATPMAPLTFWNFTGALGVTWGIFGLAWLWDRTSPLGVVDAEAQDGGRARHGAVLPAGDPSGAPRRGPG